MILAVEIAYGLVLGALFAYGAQGYVLLALRRRYRSPRATPPAAWPEVLVQIPVYDERDVAARVVGAAGRLAYPGRWTIQVLDDSDDDTTQRIASAAAALRGEGVEIEHVRRGNREGFKAGALAGGLERSAAEVVAILDADFVPSPDFLLRTVPHLCQPGVACVQARWGHLDPSASELTRAQATAIDVHFAIEQRARAAAGWPVAFNGSAGVFRRSAIDAAGGWSADTLTEDLDLSYRVWLGGGRILYDDDVVCPGEIPSRLAAFKAQQRRWARGSTEVARKVLGRIWRACGPTFASKVAATLHLTHYAVHPLMLLSALLALPLGLWAGHGSSLWTLLPPLALATGGPLAMALAVGRDAGLPLAVRLRDAAAMTVLGVGLAVSNSVAVLAGLRGGRAEFERTPKGGARSSYRCPASRCELLGPLELAAAAGCAALALWLLERGVVAIVPFLALYALGLGTVGAATIWETVRNRPRSAEPESLAPIAPHRERFSQPR